MGWLNWLCGNGFAEGTISSTRGTDGCTGEAGGVTRDSCSAGSAGHPPSAIFTYITLCIINEFFHILAVSLIKCY